MKYFTSDLWIKLNSYDENERKLAEIQWDANNRKYSEYFSEIERLLPQKFIKTYLKNYGFHDYKINSINIKAEKKKQKSTLTIIVEIENYKKSFSIIYQDVNHCNVDMSDVTNCFWGEINWGYSEFELLDSGLIKQNISCDINSEIEIEFKKVIIKSKKS
ncbi:hypothetical protein QA584_20185 [Anaerocolumna sp. AGMB13025]|uniref:hypothetical protein n=1 Tax=Anaerocolumna sp. AGMB13025 TaxID=3039116 RepID=UPI00241D626A|nr:hypothetical protein [Anaerocolumna sp. AGMB13025]WFR55919.1 hypothetical protein QA584_20185 [Anaerocolumna sp. AGMB13025]